MPSNNVCPRFGLISEFDARPFKGETLFTRGSAFTYDAVAPDTFEDTVAFLNGHCSYFSLSEILQTASDAVNPTLGTWTVGINTDDKVYIQNSSTTQFTFTVSSGRLFERLGFALGYTTSSVVGSVAIVTATNDWVRGDFAILGETINKSGLPINFALSEGRVQDVPILIRGTDEADLDTFSLYHLQKRDNDTLSASTTLVRWGINSMGHVFCWTKTGTTVLTFNDIDFRNRLGFNGTTGSNPDVSVSEGGGVTLTARYPLPGCIIPSRPYDRLESISESFSNSVVLTDGRINSNYVSTHYRWFVSCYLDGPADAINSTTREDLHKQWQNRCRPYLSAGAPCSLYQEWGDSRRAQERSDYGLLYTNELGGYRGRLIGYMAKDNATVHQVSWPNTIRIRSPLNFTIQTLGTEFGSI